MTKIRVALVVASQLLVSLAPGPAFGQGAAGPLEAASIRWLQLLDQGRFDDAWNEGASLLHQDITKNQWTDGTRHVRDRFGAVQGRELLAKDYHRQIQDGPDGDYFTLRYQTSFTDGRPPVVELITLVLAPDEQYRPVAYGIKR